MAQLSISITSEGLVMLTIVDEEKEFTLHVPMRPIHAIQVANGLLEAANCIGISNSPLILSPTTVVPRKGR